MAKVKYRIKNWREYNNSLKKRGSLTVWLEEGFEKTWYAFASEVKKKGQPFIYSDAYMKLLATLRHVFKLALRQLEGFINLMEVKLKVPEFSRLSRRLSESLKSLTYSKTEEINHIVINSSGLKVFGEKEFIEIQKRKPYFRRIWRKLYIAIDGKGFIRASKMTSHKINDRACFESLIDTVGSNHINEVLADTGYDSHKAYKVCEDRNIKTIIPPPRNAKQACKNKINSKRHETINYIKEKSKHAWESHNNYGRRNRVENTFYRLKTIFNRQLISRTWKNQEAESRLICDLLNQMTNLGMPVAQKIS